MPKREAMDRRLWASWLKKSIKSRAGGLAIPILLSKLIQLLDSSKKKKGGRGEVLAYGIHVHFTLRPGQSQWVRERFGRRLVQASR
jgi:hypothetical protein